MNIFKKFGKGSSYSNSNTSQQTMLNTEEKAKNCKLEEQIKHLNTYILDLVKVNEVLQDEILDQKTTI